MEKLPYVKVGLPSSINGRILAPLIERAGEEAGLPSNSYSQGYEMYEPGSELGSIVRKDGDVRTIRLKCSENDIGTSYLTTDIDSNEDYRAITFRAFNKTRGWLEVHGDFDDGYEIGHSPRITSEDPAVHSEKLERLVGALFSQFKVIQSG